MTTVLEHTYRPRGACIDLFNYRGPEVLMSGPAGTGKSRACLEKLHRMMLKNPGSRGLIVRKTGVSLTSTALVTYRQQVAAESLRAGHVKWYGGSQQEAAQFRYTNGSTIVVGGMDRATKIMSSEYDVVYVQEAIELDEGDWEALTTRLRHGRVSFQQLMADTNPSSSIHWLKQRCERGTTNMLESRHSDNPSIIDDQGVPTATGSEYLSKLDALTGVRRLRLRDGLWAAAEGIIWDDWNPAIHLIDKAHIPWEWQRVWGIDFGMTNPMVVQRWAIDPDGRMVLYGEHYHTGRLVEDVAAEHKKLITPEPGASKAREPRPAWIVADHDAEGRATWERHFGMSTLAAKKNVTEGLQAVAARLRVDEQTKRPKLLIQRGARAKVDQSLVDAKKPTCTEDEIPGYVWADHQTKEQPDKRDDHGCDTMRYVVAQLDVGGRPSMRFMTY